MLCGVLLRSNGTPRRSCAHGMARSCTSSAARHNSKSGHVFSSRYVLDNAALKHHSDMHIAFAGDKHVYYCMVDELHAIAG